MVRTGLEALLDEHIDELRGLRVGLLCNQASIASDGLHACDALVGAGVNISALFCPEHGIRGEAAAGIYVQDSYDQNHGIPVFSLYGKNRSPSNESLNLIDVMLIDVQEVGARFYTYISTMAKVMIACGELGIPVYVLDRPNPISGLCPEGPILEPEQASFVGMYSIPIRHGLSIGELAELFVERLDISCELKVIPMQGWLREMFFDDSGCRWVNPSPNIISPETTLYYPGTCLFEGTNISEGRGSLQPFQMIGAPWLKHTQLRDALECIELTGVSFDIGEFTAAKYPDEVSRAIIITAVDRKTYRPVLTAVAILTEIQKLHPIEFEFQAPFDDGRRFFDLLAGTDKMRKSIEAGIPALEIANEWELGIAKYAKALDGVLIYQTS
ncbi:MAG: DUF1343 domain-containing protein [Armatimonadetes bacterium]|nr:DUF1343 domain-containing protein [Armatimonadota bacterium]